MDSDPLKPLLDRSDVVLLDGGLATELAARGFDLDDDLWSARFLLEKPEAIRRVHLDYLEAGADCIVTSSYQATIEGFEKKGIEKREAVDLLRRSVQLAQAARDEFWGRTANRSGRVRPLVAASVGPYGAYLADGSEYTGAYDLDEDGLVEFHRERWDVLATAGADLLACETIPSLPEARALARLLHRTKGARAWFSFTCADGSHISDGTPISDVIARLDAHERIVAVGVNCTPPRLIPDLIRKVRRATHKTVVVYPNSGERYDAMSNRWERSEDTIELSEACLEWRGLGAQLIGGCCRTRPADIQKMSQKLRQRRMPSS
jgi:homocysteine S-methyltransferase